MKILITGGLGFIGSNFFNYMREKYPDYEMLILDSETYASNRKNINNLSGCRYVKFDIIERERLFELFDNYKFEYVIHFAAESHVDNSILNPLKFVQSNIVGTINLLDASVKYGVKLFYHISTDEDFGQLGPTGSFNENTPYDPRSPYSASKASADHFVRAYHHTYNLPVVISNCSNNYGPNQHDEKFIPTVIKKVLKSEKIPVYGNGLNIRDWLYVNDHVEAIDAVFHGGKIGETYCIGGGYEITNIRLAKIICDKIDYIKDWDRDSKELIEFVEDRKGHDHRYSIDNSKINKTLAWEPKTSFDEGIEKTIKYYLNKFGS